MLQRLKIFRSGSKEAIRYLRELVGAAKLPVQYGGECDTPLENSELERKLTALVESQATPRSQ